jgi:hypothetical protein
MSEIRVDADIDTISVADVRSLGAAQGPCVSMFLPTHRSGRETLQGSIRLRNLINTARGELSVADLDETVIDSIVAPLESLAEDHQFWQHTAEGLALFSAPGRFERYRVSLSLTEEVVVAASFRVRPVLPEMSRDETFYVLSLSQNAVQLFEATRSSITMLDLGRLRRRWTRRWRSRIPSVNSSPTRRAESASSSMAMAPGPSWTSPRLERFLRVIDQGVCERLGDADDPLVLACVGYYLPLFQSVTRYPNVFGTAVLGNPEHRSPTELHADALRVVQSEKGDPGLQRYRVGVSAGTTVVAIADVVTRAREGRVDTLLVTDVPPVWGHIGPDMQTVSTSQRASIEDEDLIDRAVFDTLANGGEVFVTDAAALGTATGVAAILRY